MGSGMAENEQVFIDNTPPAPAAGKVYGNTSESLREAVKDLQKQREAEGRQSEDHIVEFKDAHDSDEPLTARQAAKGLSEYRAQKAAELEAAEQEHRALQDAAEAGDSQPTTPAAPVIAPEVEQQLQERRQQANAEFEAAARARSAYEQLTIRAYTDLRDSLNSEFPDIRSQQDAIRLAQENPARWAAWQARQDAMRTAETNGKALAEQRQKENNRNFDRWCGEETELLISRNPELKDPDKFQKLSTGVVAMLRGTGLSDSELYKLRNGEIGLNLNHHSAVEVMLKAVKYDEMIARQKALRPVNPALPPVQRPGVARNSSEIRYDAVREARQEFEKKPTARSGARLLKIQREHGER
jgi:hypothetical protein